MKALCGEIVGAMTKRAGRARSVDSTNIAYVVEQLARVAMEKTAYITTNRADFSASDLGDLARFAAEKMMRSIMEMTDTTKLPPNKMAALVAAASKGGAKGAGTNTNANTGTRKLAMISAFSAGAAAGVRAGVTSSRRPMFRDNSQRNQLAARAESFAAAAARGAVEGALAIDTSSFSASDLGATYKQVLYAQVEGAAAMAKAFPFYSSDSIAECVKKMTQAAAGALGAGTFTPSQITTILTQGAEGMLDGLRTIDTADADILFSLASLDAAVGQMTIGIVSGLDAMSRNGMVMSAADFKTVKDAVMAAISAYAATIGTTLFASTFDAAVMLAAITAAETAALSNVTSISGFDPIAAMGDAICSGVTAQSACGQGSMAPICEWVGAACSKKTVIDLCGSATSESACTMRGQWCKWDALSCSTKSAAEVDAAESLKTMAPTMAPTIKPTSASTFDVCRLCTKSALAAARLASSVCASYATQHACPAPSSLPDVDACKFGVIKEECAGVVMWCVRTRRCAGAPAGSTLTLPEALVALHTHHTHHRCALSPLFPARRTASPAAA